MGSLVGLAKLFRTSAQLVRNDRITRGSDSVQYVHLKDPVVMNESFANDTTLREKRLGTAEWRWSLKVGREKKGERRKTGKGRYNRIGGRTVDYLRFKSCSKTN
ncbi:Hypothetical predicted protein [Xyrichtys novacula]|uniref:Uncharacterized protein n=1 Tax=Xyrichtys novacula TaxID=13765 RepID=A0AAV1GBL9_XYRNO|nr:Hypothetical predicted protein [Xyrichtys novacula]